MQAKAKLQLSGFLLPQNACIIWLEGQALAQEAWSKVMTLLCTSPYSNSSVIEFSLQWYYYTPVDSQQKHNRYTNKYVTFKIQLETNASLYMSPLSIISMINFQNLEHLRLKGNHLNNIQTLAFLNVNLRQLLFVYENITTLKALRKLRWSKLENFVLYDNKIVDIQEIGRIEMNTCLNSLNIDEDYFCGGFQTQWKDEVSKKVQMQDLRRMMKLRAFKVKEMALGQVSKFVIKPRVVTQKINERFKETNFQFKSYQFVQ